MALAPLARFTYHEATLHSITKMVKEISSKTAATLSQLSKSLDSLAGVVLDNRIALDYILAEQGGICTVLNKTCCTYINNSGLVETNIKQIYEQAKWLHKFNAPIKSQDLFSSFLPNMLWLLPLLGPLVSLILLLIFGPCLFNLLVKFTSSRLQQFHLKLMMVRGFQPLPQEKDSQLLKALDLHCSAFRLQEHTV